MSKQLPDNIILNDKRKDRYVVYGRYPSPLIDITPYKVGIETAVFTIITDFNPANPKQYTYYVDIVIDINYQEWLRDGTLLRILLRELKSAPHSFTVILPTDIINWYRGSITNMCKILAILKRLSGPDHSHTVTDKQISDYFIDLRKESAMHTDALLKSQGRLVGRPIKHVPIEQLLDMACSGQSVATIAKHFKVSRMLIWRRIRSVFTSTDTFLKNKAKLAETRIKDNDPLKSRREAIAQTKLIRKSA